MAAPLTRMLFFVQVSQYATCDTYSILILPVPPPVLFASVRAHACRFRPVSCRRYRFKLLRRFAFYFLLLLICGDVEMNPGPDDSVLKQLLDGQKEIKKELGAIEKHQAESNSAISDLNERMTKLETTLTKLEELHSVVKGCKQICEVQQVQLQALVDKVDDLENHSRRCNLIFYGVKDDERETYEKAEEHILEVCQSKLQCENVSIERAHRLGRHNPNKKRPIMVKFLSFKEKQAVLSSARKLKGSDISISEDFSESVRKKRKRLWDYAKANRVKTDKVNIKFTTLYINKVKYVYDESLDQVVQAD
ncbi:uncharacterized protein LOC125947472 [Dermacentor silvarum]|uniref:uncharacterized protein LOC125947472 n=1 Tax=Dermacentor silvarum TaxID=543639 RepID=UPI002100DAC7|nr:uncharacterized protein LOC125947472 [Dermacentor silvarum]